MALVDIYSGIMRYWHHLRGARDLRQRLIQLDREGWRFDKAKQLVSEVFSIGISKEDVVILAQKELGEIICLDVDNPSPGQEFETIRGAKGGNYIDKFGCDAYLVAQINLYDIFGHRKKYYLQLRIWMKQNEVVAIGISDTWRTETIT